MKPSKNKLNKKKRKMMSSEDSEFKITKRFNNLGKSSSKLKNTQTLMDNSNKMSIGMKLNSI